MEPETFVSTILVCCCAGLCLELRGKEETGEILERAMGLATAMVASAGPFEIFRWDPKPAMSETPFFHHERSQEGLQTIRSQQ